MLRVENGTAKPCQRLAVGLFQDDEPKCRWRINAQQKYKIQAIYQRLQFGLPVGIMYYGSTSFGSSTTVGSQCVVLLLLGRLQMTHTAHNPMATDRPKKKNPEILMSRTDFSLGMLSLVWHELQSPYAWTWLLSTSADTHASTLFRARLYSEDEQSLLVPLVQTVCWHNSSRDRLHPQNSSQLTIAVAW